MNNTQPYAPRDQFIIQEMDGELVVYDTARAQANVLNPTAAVIWKLCDGKTSVNEIAQRASRELGAPIDTALVWYTLNQLSKKNLLQTRVTMPLNLKTMTRRDFLRAGVVGAAVVLPVIVTMTAPHVTNAATCVGVGEACLENSDCCSDDCSDGFCQ